MAVGSAQCCSNVCSSAYKSDIIPSSPTRVTLRPTGGVVTVRAAYIPDTTWSWEYIRFMKEENMAEPIVIQIYYGKPGLLGKVSMYAEDDDGPYSYTRYSETSVFADLEEDIVIQISDIHVDEDNAYRVYLGTPGEASFIKYNYNNNRSAAWDELSYMRFNTTRQIKTDNNAIYFKSVTVCSDDVPLLCDTGDVVVPAVQGHSLNLTCSGSGAPDLESVWISNGNEALGTITEPAIIEKVSNVAADQLLTSTVVIKSFKETHVGIWRCYIRNKNLATFSRTKTFYVTEIIQEPVNTHYNITKKSEIYNKIENDNEYDTFSFRTGHDEDLQLPSNSAKHQVFKWVIKGWPSTQSENQSDVLLECQHEPYQIDPEYITYEYNSANFQHSAILTLPEELTADSINCSLSLAIKRGDTTHKVGVVISTTLYRVGYWCKEGQYGVGDKCLACPDKMTSNNVECAPNPIRDSLLDEENDENEDFTFLDVTPSNNSSPVNMTVLVVSVMLALVILITVIAVIFIAFKYKHNCKSGCCSKKIKDTDSEVPVPPVGSSTPCLDAIV